MRAGRDAGMDFPRAKAKQNMEEQLFQPEENPVIPDSFTPVYILFEVVLVYRYFKIYILNYTFAFIHFKFYLK